MCHLGDHLGAGAAKGFTSERKHRAVVATNVLAEHVNGSFVHRARPVFIFVSTVHEQHVPVHYAVNLVLTPRERLRQHPGKRHDRCKTRQPLLDPLTRIHRQSPSNVCFDL